MSVHECDRVAEQQKNPEQPGFAFIGAFNVFPPPP